MPSYSLYDHAPDAVWTGNDENNKLIPWKSWTYKIFSPAADLCTDVLQDGQSHPKAIFTHPAWRDDGYVQGDFTIPLVGDTQHFLALVGYAEGAQSPTDRDQHSGVKALVYFRNELIHETVKYYTGALEGIDIDMSRWAGQAGNLRIRVDANGGAGRDFFCWVNPRIETVGY